LPNGEEYEKTLTIVIPEEGRWYVTIVFDVTTYSGDMAKYARSDFGSLFNYHKKKNILRTLTWNITARH